MKTTPCPPEWWTTARFGLFIHWGVYAVPAGDYLGKTHPGASEWLMHHAKIPVADYKAFAAGFEAARYDPEAWVQAAVEAGMGYLIITTKHHDGFALHGSKISSWNAVEAAACRRDLLDPLVTACRNAGLRFGFYYSHAQDWCNGGGIFGDPWDPAQIRDFDDYLDNVAIPQIRELLTLHKPDVLWWDTPVHMTEERAARVHAAVEAVSPGILQNDRLALVPGGHFSTPEQRIPARRPPRAWETCMTTNESWGYSAHDRRWKSPSLLIQQLCEVVSMGGNYLLNVGPRADGTIPAESLEALRVIGRWMDRHGAAIRGASAGPFPHRLPWGVSTRHGNTIYLLVTRWPENGFLDVPLLDLPEAVKILGPEGPAPVANFSGGGIRIPLAGGAPDPAVSVIALTYARPPRLGEMPPLPPPPVITQPADGTVVLRAADAELVGDHIGLLSDTDPHIGCWSNLDSFPAWRLRLKAAGSYRIELEYAIPAHRQGTTVEICIGTKSLAFTIPETGGWGCFVRASPGVLELEPADATSVRLTPKNMPAGAVMNLRCLTLTPL